jgi:hypothetical protein
VFSGSHERVAVEHLQFDRRRGLRTGRSLALALSHGGVGCFDMHVERRCRVDMRVSATVDSGDRHARPGTDDTQRADQYRALGQSPRERTV